MKFKRFLSFVLALTLVLSYVPVGAFATETGDETPIVSDETPNDSQSETPSETPADESEIAQIDESVNTVTVVATEAELAAALAEGGDIKLETQMMSGMHMPLVVSSVLTVPADKTVNLDLNGITVMMNDQYLVNEGTLTVKNGTLAAGIFNDTTNGAAIYNKGTLVVEANVSGVCAAIRTESGKVTINSGTISATENSGKTAALLRVKGGEVVINGGTFVGCNSTNGNEGCLLFNVSGGSVVVNGGHFSDFAGQTMPSYAQYVTISAGTFVPGNTDGWSLAHCLEGSLAPGYEVNADGAVVKTPPQGNNFTGYMNETAIWGEVWGNALTSFVIKVLDANGNVMGTTSLNNIDGIIDGDLNVTWNLKLDAASNTDEYWTMNWTNAPTLTNVPAAVELWVDGTKVSGGDVVMHGPDGLHPIFAAKTDAEGKILSYIACDGFNLSNASAKLQSAINAGDNVAILAAGSYAVPSGKDCTITGAVDGVVFENIGAHNMGSANVTFNNVTFNYAANSTYKGLQHSGNMVYNNCTFNGQVFLYGESETFNNCTFVQTDADNYNVWTYGAKAVTFNKCTFNSAGKSVLVYNEGATHFIDLKVEDTTFNASQVVEGKAAIEIDTSLTSGANISIDADTTATGFGSGNVSGNSLWNNKKGNETAENNDVTVVVNNETVLKPIVLGLSGEGTAASPYLINNLEELVWFQKDVNSDNKYQGKVVKLNADIDLGGMEWTPISTFNGVFDGGNHTISNLVITGNKSNAGFFGQTNNGEIKNLTFNNAKVSGYLNVGVVAGTPYTSKYTNIKVTGHVEVNGYAYVGGVGGKNAYANWTDITVDVDSTSYVKAESEGYRTYVGGVIGFNGEGGHTFKNISSNIAVIGSTADIGGIFGIAHYSNKFENITFTGSVTAPEDAIQVGGIAGVWHNEKGTSVSFSNVTSTGTVTVGDETTTGSIVGGAYNASNDTAENSGSLIIDGSEAWLKTISIGETKFASLKAAAKAAQAGDEIVLLADVAVNEAASLTGITLKGNGFKLTNNSEISFTDCALEGVTIEGSGTTRFYNEINFYGENNILSGINGAPFHLIVNKGATLLISRFVLGYDRNITVYGEIEDAHSFDPEGKTPSLKFNSTSGVSVGGTGTGNLTVVDAYIELGNSSWKNAQGTYEWNFKNSYVSATSFTDNKAGYTEDAAWNVTFDDSVLAAKNYIKNGVGATYNFTNGSVATTGSMKIDGVLNIDATSSVTASAQQNNKHGAASEHEDINGTVNVAGTLNIGGNSYMEVLTGELNVNGGTVNITSAKPLHIAADGTVNVNSGTVNGDLDVTGKLNSKANINGTITAADSAKISISGGIYTQDVSAWCANGYVAVDNGDGTYKIKSENEAWILRNGMPKYYGSLAEAVADAQENEVIILAANIELSERINIDKNITIGDYGTLTLSIVGNGGINVIGDAEVTLDTFNIDISGAAAKGDCIIGVGNYSNNGKLTLNNVNVTGDGYSSAYAVFYVYNNSELNINGGNITLSNDKASAGGFIKAHKGKDGIVNITDAEISLTDAKIGFLDGTVKLDGVELNIKGGANAINQSALTVIDSTITVDGADGRALTLSQGDVTVVNSTLNFSNCAEGEIRFKKGLTLNVDAASTISDCNIYADASAVDVANVNGEVITGVESNMSAIEGGKVVNPDWVAKIGNTYYMTINEALTAAQAGDEVVIFAGEYTQSIAVNKAITVTGETDAEGNNLVKINGGISITANGAAVKNLTASNPATSGYNMTLSISAGDVLVEGCEITDHNAVRYSKAKGLVTFKDSVLTGDVYGIHFDGATGGEIVIDNCVITGWTSFAATIKKVTMTDTTFAEGTYNYVRFYQEEVVIDGCTFNEKMDAIDIVGSADVTVDNSTFKGGEIADLFEKADIDASDIVVDGERLITPAAEINGVVYDTLAEAIAAAKNGDTIVLVDALKEDVTVVQAPDVKITIDGNGYYFSGTITVDGKSAAYATAGLTIQNVNFNAKNISKDASINLGGSNTTRYTSNVTVIDCSFEGADQTKAGIKSYTGGCKNLSVIGCSATGMHSLMQLYKTTGLVIDDCTVTDSKNGISVRSSEGTITNCTIDVDGYGIRADGDSVSTLTVRGNTIDAAKPVIVRKTTADGYKLAVEGNTLNTEGEYQVIITKGDDEEAPVDPACKFVFEGNTDDLSVYPCDLFVADIDGIGYMSLEAAVEAAAAGETVVLLKDIELSETVNVTGTVVLNLNGKNITGTDNSTGNFALIQIQPGADLTVNGEGKITLTANNDRNWNNYSSVISNQRGKLTVNGGTIEHLGGTDMAYAIDNLTNGKGTYAETVINGGVIKSPYRAIRQFLNGTEAQNILSVNGGTIEGGNKAIWMQDANANANSGKLAVAETADVQGDIYLFVTAGSTEWPVEVSIAASAVSGEVITGNVPGGYELAEIDGNYTVMSGAAKIGNTYYQTISGAIAAANAGETVTVLAGNYTENLTVNKAITVVGATDAEGNNLVNITGNVSASTGSTIKNLNVHNTKTGTYDCALDVNGKDIVIDGVKLTGYNAMRYCYATGDITIKNSTINGSNFAVHFDGKEGGNIAFENCDITGWVSYASTINSVSYTGCSFDQGNYAGHRYFNKNVSFNECDFAEGFKIELKASGSNVAFTDSDMTMDEVEDLFKDLYYVAKGNVTLNNEQLVYAASVYVNGATQYYMTLQEAIDAADNGKYITLRSDNVLKAPITVPAGKQVTVGMNGFNISYTSNVPGEDMITNKGDLTIDGDGVITYTNTDTTASNVTVSTISNEPGASLTVIDATVENKSGNKGASGIYAYAIDNLTNGNLGSVSATIDGATITSEYIAIRQFINSDTDTNTLTVTDGYIYGATRAINIHNKKNDTCVLNISGGKIEGGSYSVCAITDSQNIAITGGEYVGSLYFGETSPVSGGIFDEAVYEGWCAPGYIPTKNNDGTYGVVKAVNVAAEINGFHYATLAEAIAVVKDGETIYLINDCAETVTVKQVAGKSFTIDGNGKNFTGTINVDGGKRSSGAETLTIQNVNFVLAADKQIGVQTVSGSFAHNVTVDGCTFTGTAGLTTYGLKLQNAYNITVKNVTASDLFELVYSNKVVTGFTAENVTATNVTYGFFLSYVKNASFKNVKVVASEAGIVINNYNASTATFEGCDLTAKWPVYLLSKSATNAYELVFTGINTMTPTTEGDVWLYVDDSDANFKVTLNDAGLDAGLIRNMVAKVGNSYYNSLSYAIADAADGETVTLIADIAIDCNDAVALDDTYKGLYKVSGKSLTIDLNGKTVSGEVNMDEMLVGVFATVENGHLTLTGNGTVDVKAATDVYALLVNYDETSTLVVENGTYKLDAALDCLIYSGGDDVVTVKDGYFHLGNVGDGTNGRPWIFNVLGANERNVNVSGGTYNADISNQYWRYEVALPADKAVQDNGNGTWTVVDANVTNGTRGFVSLTAAVAAAEDGDTITVLASHKITEPAVVKNSINIDLGGKTLTGENVYPIIRVQDNANVIINNGTITNDHYIFILGASDGSSYGYLTIQGGNYHGETTVASVTKGDLVIEGGYFSVEPYGGEGYQNYNFLLNCIDANYKYGDANIIVKGGSFENFNPADNAAEGLGTNFVDPLYKSTTVNGSVWNVTAYNAGEIPENPIYVEWVWNEAGTEATATVSAAVGTTYFAAYGMNGTVLTANGEELEYVPGFMFWTPATFEIVNDGAAEATYELKISYPVGSSSNPAQLVIGDNTATIEAGNDQGYFFTWTADADGALTITMPEGGWTYVINNLTSGQYGDMQWSDSDPVVNPAIVEFAAGDELQVIVNTYDPATPWSAPAGDITFNVAEGYPVGHEMNPIFLLDQENDVTQSGETWYQGYFSGMIMTVEGQGDFSVIYNGVTTAAVDGKVEMAVASANPRMPVIFAVVGDGEFGIDFTYPIGNMSNPAELVIGDNTAAIDAGSQGYYYTWTAEEDGELVITMPETGWMYVMNNMTTYQYGDMQWSDSDPVVNPGVIAVNKGDEVQVTVSTYDPANPWNAPAGELTVSAEFVAAPGTEVNPIGLFAQQNNVTAQGTSYDDVTYYYGYFSGMIMTVEGQGDFSVIYNGVSTAAVDGKVEMAVASANPRMPVNFAIDGNGEYAVNFQYPVGNMENPAELVIGDNTASIEAGNSQGYFFTWTAEEDGTLIITMPEGDWTYAINNLTSYRYGDTQWSDSDPVVNPAYVSVSAGDELQIMVNSYDPNNMWSNPAADITLNAVFNNANNPFFIDWIWNDEGTEGTATVSVPAGITLYYGAYVSGMELTINGESAGILNGNRWMPAVFAVANNGTAETDYELKLTYPVGSMSNPAELVIGDNTASIEAGNNQGYFFTWTAPAAGILTITMPEGDWTYVINNMTSYQYGDTQWSDSDPVVNPAVLHVAAGDELQIMVNSYDPANVWSNPAAELVFNAAFAGHEENPIMVEWNWNEDWTAATATVEVGANATYYYSAAASGMELTINGESAGILNGSRWMPAVFTVANDSDEVATFELAISYPVGSMDNPAQLVIGDNTASIVEGNTQGYFYTWTAEEDGILIITMPEDGWTYAINNMTSYQYGDTQWSDSDPVVNPAYVNVSAGDELQIMVSTYDPANPWSAPAGDLTFTAEFIVPVAQNVETGKVYGSVADALAEAVSGQTVILTADTAEDLIYVRANRTLDLNGYTLTANDVVAVNSANIVDNSAANTGLLVVNGENVILSATNAQLPVWNGTGYIFTVVNVNSRAVVQNVTEDGFRYLFQPIFEDTARALLVNGAEDNDVTIEVRVSWENENGREYRNLVFGEEAIIKILSVAPNGAFTLNFAGFKSVGATGTEVLVQTVVKSEIGASAISTGKTVDFSNN